MCFPPRRQSSRARFQTEALNFDDIVLASDTPTVRAAKEARQAQRRAVRTAALAAAAAKKSAESAQPQATAGGSSKQHASKAPTQPSAPDASEPPSAPAAKQNTAVASADSSADSNSSPPAPKRAADGTPKAPVAAPKPASSRPPFGLPPSDDEDDDAALLGSSPAHPAAVLTHTQCMAVVDTAVAPVVAPKGGVRADTFEVPTTFVLTGVFECDGGMGLNRGKDGVEALICLAGGTVKSSVSGKTDYVVAGAMPGQGKVKAAKERDVPVITAAALVKMLEGSTEEPELAPFGAQTAWSLGYGAKQRPAKKAKAAAPKPKPKPTAPAPAVCLSDPVAAAPVVAPPPRQKMVSARRQASNIDEMNRQIQAALIAERREKLGLPAYTEKQMNDAVFYGNGLLR